MPSQVFNSSHRQVYTRSVMPPLGENASTQNPTIIIDLYLNSTIWSCDHLICQRNHNKPLIRPEALNQLLFSGCYPSQIPPRDYACAIILPSNYNLELPYSIVRQ